MGFHVNRRLVTNIGIITTVLTLAAELMKKEGMVNHAVKKNVFHGQREGYKELP